jgi:hypothetical protein
VTVLTPPPAARHRAQPRRGHHGGHTSASRHPLRVDDHCYHGLLTTLPSRPVALLEPSCHPTTRIPAGPKHCLHRRAPPPIFLCPNRLKLPINSPQASSPSLTSAPSPHNPPLLHHRHQLHHRR